MDENLENPAIEEVDDGQGVVVDAQEEHGAGEYLDSAGASDNETDAAGQEVQREQTREDNAAARAARIRAEQDTTQRLQQEYDNKISGLGVVNPYTGKPFRNFREFEEYGAQFRTEQLAEEAKRQGKTPEELQEERDNRDYISQKRREDQIQRQAMEKVRGHNDFVGADLRTFVNKYPDVDVTKLEQNQKFRKFAGDRLYKAPLYELYGDFVELVSDAERVAVEKATGRQARSTGGGGAGGGDTLTARQQEQLDEWNRENPHLKMTPKEFSGR